MSNEEVEYAPPLDRIQIYCAALYNHMDLNSKMVQLEDGQPIKIWTGFTTKASDLVEIPEGVRNRVVRRLTDIGSIQVVEQGRRGYPSIVALLYPPTTEAWEGYFERKPLTNRPDPAMLASQVKSLTERVGEVDIGEAFKNLEERVTKLERQVRSLSGEGE